MAKLYAFCGLDCSGCPAYIGTQKDDNEMRAKLAEEWSKEYGANFKPEDINCDGCTSKARHIPYCAMCEIRVCGIKKGVENCAFCDEYKCEKLTKFHEMAPEAGKNLEAINKQMSEGCGC